MSNSLIIWVLLLAIGLVAAQYWVRRSPVGLLSFKAGLFSRLGRLGGQRPFDPAGRADANRFTRLMIGNNTVLSGIEKNDRVLPIGETKALRCVSYRPQNGENLPVLLWIHGGCWMIGEPDLGQEELSYIAREAGMLVVSPDYRLAPEHPYPAGLDDCEALLLWLRENAAEWGGDGQKISVGGSSAGGNLAAALAIRARDQKIALRSQYLRAPITDALHTWEWPSYQKSKAGFVLSPEAMIDAIAYYTPDDALRIKGSVSPLREPDLQGLPEAIILTMDLDPLHDQGKAYALRLIEAGVEVEHRTFESCIHDFIGSDTQLREASKLAVAMFLRVNN